MWQQATSSADVKQPLPMEAKGPCHCQQLSCLVDLVLSAVSKLSAAAPFHSSSEGGWTTTLCGINLHLHSLAPCSCVLGLPKSLLYSLGAKCQYQGGCHIPDGHFDLCQSIAGLVAQGHCLHL